MSSGMIDTSRIDAMVAQLRTAAAKMNNTASAASPTAAPAPKLDFAQALKANLDSVNSAQSSADELGKQFALGDPKVGLSDVMISMQKANIAFQTTVQVRSRLVAAYQSIMNMQI
jgi:flagellar hook-basal body complex protein FliE